MSVFTVYFANGCTHTQEANTPLEAAILAQGNLIRQGLYPGIDSIQNEENGKVYKIEQRIIEVKND